MSDMLGIVKDVFEGLETHAPVGDGCEMVVCANMIMMVMNCAIDKVNGHNRNAINARVVRWKRIESRG